MFKNRLDKHQKVSHWSGVSKVISHITYYLYSFSEFYLCDNFKNNNYT